MPNHCENELTITADTEILELIVKTHIKELTDSPYDKCQLDFNTIIPYPEECAKADKALQEEKGFPHAFSKEGYDWCVSNWGTKWNSYSVSYAVVGDQLQIDLDTAWSPPIPIVEKLSELYPQAKFKLEFREEGMCFAGMRKFAKGRLVESADWEISPDFEEEEEWAETIE